MPIASPYRACTLIAASMMVAACDGATGERAPQGLSEGERDRLEAAAERLDARPAGPGAADAAALEADTRNRIATEQAAQAPRRQ
jgi:hypothetical protein